MQFSPLWLDPIEISDLFCSQFSANFSPIDFMCLLLNKGIVTLADVQGHRFKNQRLGNQNKAIFQIINLRIMIPMYQNPKQSFQLLQLLI